MLRHAAASLLSAAGVLIEDISDTLGHRSVAVTAEIYRHPIAPIRSGHMIAMSQLFDTPPEPKDEAATGQARTDEGERSAHEVEKVQAGRRCLRRR